MKSMKETQLQNIEPVIISSLGKDSFVYSEPLRGDLARQVYDETRGIADKDYKNAPSFNGYWKFNDETKEINGSSTFLVLVADKVLSKQGLQIPQLRD